MPLAGAGQIHRREAAVEHQDQLPLGEPAANLQDHLPGPVDRRLVRGAAAGALGPAQGGQEGQGPHPVAPGDRDQNHQSDPLQPEALHDVLATRPHGIAVAALGPNAAAGAALDGIVGGQDDRPVAGEDGDDQAEQDLPGGQAGPGVAVQDAVVVGEVPLLAEPHDPQDRTDGAVAGSQEGSDGQELGLDPDAVGEQGSEGGQDGYDLRWQIQGGRSPRTMACMSPSIVANDPLDLPADLAKVEFNRRACPTQDSVRSTTQRIFPNPLPWGVRGRAKWFSIRRRFSPSRLRGVPYCRSPYRASGRRRRPPRGWRIRGTSSRSGIARSDSFRWAPLIRTAKGVPFPSTSRWRFEPFLARSVGFLPVSTPQKQRGSSGYPRRPSTSREAPRDRGGREGRARASSRRPAAASTGVAASKSHRSRNPSLEVASTTGYRFGGRR